MPEKKPYDRQLRAVGQSLEAQRIRIFELHQQGDRFIVKGEPAEETSLLAKLLYLIDGWTERPRPNLHVLTTDSPSLIA